jgi:uncharacterized membrane protein YkvA (DUF1232 family)
MSLAISFVRIVLIQTFAQTKNKETKNMNHIKVEDLMLHDWVCYNQPNQYNTQVTQLRLVSGVLPNDEIWFIKGQRDDNDYLKTEFDETFIDSLLFPIDLTPEIFQANGFSVDSGYAILNLGDGKWLEFYFHEHRFTMYYEGIDEWQNHSKVRDIVCRCHCYYVHEVQQALRQWYLKDMANNFKLK